MRAAVELGSLKLRSLKMDCLYDISPVPQFGLLRLAWDSVPILVLQPFSDSTQYPRPDGGDLAILQDS